MPSTALITGAYGYLGSVIRARLEHAGWETVALVRTPRPGDRAHAWRLGEDVDEAVWKGIDALVHCAYDMSARSRDDVWRINVEGSAHVVGAAARAGIQRLLVISSMSAYPGTSQLYGSAKLEVERRTLELGGIAIRPGLVYGPRPGGMAGTLLRLTRLPVVPVLTGGGRQFPVHEDDLARVVTSLLSAPNWTAEVFGVAQQDPMSLRDLLSALAAQEGRTCRFLPVPWQLAYAALRVAETLKLPLPVRSDSVAGLVRPAPSVPPSKARPDLTASLRTLDPRSRHRVGPGRGGKPDTRTSEGYSATVVHDAKETAEQAGQAGQAGQAEHDVDAAER
jgi:nucleoside-diphosphate-sugar epimerase